MDSIGKYRYKIKIQSISDVFAFTKTAIACSYDVTLVNGKHRLNGKSYLGVALARASWDEIFIETDEDCYFDFENYIEK